MDFAAACDMNGPIVTGILPHHRGAKCSCKGRGDWEKEPVTEFEIQRSSPDTIYPLPSYLDPIFKSTTLSDSFTSLTNLFECLILLP